MIKKPILILVALLMFAGIASASVESDSLKIRYDKCIQQLSALDSVHYTKPNQSDPAFAPGNPGNKTYASSLANYNNQIAYRENKRAECKSLYSGDTTATVSSKSIAKGSTLSSAPETEKVVIDPIATHPVILHIESTINKFWILFGLIVFLLLVITWKVFRKEK